MDLDPWLPVAPNLDKAMIQKPSFTEVYMNIVIYLHA